MAARGTFDSKRAGARALYEKGLSCNAIAQELGASPSTISRWAKEEGLSFDRTKTEAAVKAHVIDMAAELATISAEMAEVAKQELRRARKPYIVHAFGGMSNDYSQHTLPLPPAEAVRSMQTTAAVAHDKIVKFLDRQVDGAQTVAESLLDKIEAGLSQFDDGDDDDIAQ